MSPPNMRPRKTATERDIRDVDGIVADRMDGSNGVWTQPAGARPHPEFSGGDRAGGVHVTAVRRARFDAEFFIAAAVNFVVGTVFITSSTITWRPWVAKTVRAQFARSAQGEWQIDRFAVSDEA